jgi:hypothetical protein
VINGTTQQASTNFNISGAGTIGTDLTVTGNASIGGTATITGATTLSSLTASKGVFTDASKRLTSTGTLGTDQGGTGMTSFNSGGAMYATSTSALTTGTLPTSAGGTGLTSYTSGGALYTTSTTAITSGTLPLTAGGTGATTKAGAFDALSPMTTAGDIIIGGTSGTGTRLGVGTNGQVLSLVSGAPAWSTIPTASASAAGYLASADWSTFNAKQAAYTNLTTIGSLSNGAGFLKNTGTGTFTYANPAVSEITGLGTGVATWLATPSSANFAAAITDETGTGSVVLATSPTLVTPTLGVASATSVAFAGSTSGTATISAPAVAGTGTAITLPAASGTLATLAGTETLTNKTLTSPTFTAPVLGTPASGVLTNATGLPLTTGVTGTLPIANGGTGATTKAAAFDALSPMTTAGDIIYGGTSGTGTRLAKGTDGQVLTLASGVPSWATPAGVTSIGAISGSSTAYGASITSGVLNLAPADGTNGGVVTTAAQTFAGAKTFSSDLTVNGLTIGRGNTGDNTNTALGLSALLTNTGGVNNTAVGYNALKMTNGDGTTGSYNVALGYSTLSANTTGSFNVASGAYTLASNTSGSKNSAFGNQSLRMNTTGGNNVGFGFSSLYNVTTASDNTSIGTLNGIGLTTGAKNTFIGSNTGSYFSTGNTSASYNTTGQNSVLIGYDVRPLANGDNNEIVLSGYNGTAGTVGLGSNSTSIGNSSTTKAQIYGSLTTVPGTTSTANGENSVIEAQDATGIGFKGGSVSLIAGSSSSAANGGDINLSAGAGASNMTGGNINLTPGTGGATGSVKVIGADLFIYDNSFRVGKGKGFLSSNTVLGNIALNSNTTGNSNTAIGSGAMYYNTTGGSNTAVGSSALTANTTGGANTALGQNALNKNTTGTDNIGIGSNSLGNNTTGNYNIGIGSLANGEGGSANTNNIGIGYYALRYNNGDRNIALGYAAGGYLGFNSTTAGPNNIFIGYSAGSNAGSASAGNTTGTNSVLIGYDVRPAATGETNEIVISGYNGTAGTVGQGSNTTSIGNASTTKSIIYGSVLSNLPSISTTGSGGDFTIEAQDAIATGNTNGGNINLTPGTPNGTGTSGIVQVNGQIKITGGSPGLGKVLTSDANGLATWSNNGGGGVLSKTATYTILTTDNANVLVFSGSTASQTITLPSAVTVGAGREITIKNIASVSVTVGSAGGYVISDSSTTTASTLAIGIEPSNNWIKAISDGTNWIILRALF